MERIRPEKKPPSHNNQNQMHHSKYDLFNWSTYYIGWFITVVFLFILVERTKRAEEDSSPLGDDENGK